MGAFRERITAQPGETLKITPEPSSVHLFDTRAARGSRPQVIIWPSAAPSPAGEKGALLQSSSK